MLDLISALLEERPTTIDFNLAEQTTQIKFIKNYFNQFGELPPKGVFEAEFNVVLPTEHAPWIFYENKLKEENFIRAAIPSLTNFNENYSQDQKQALLKLRDDLVSIASPVEIKKPVSVVKDLSRFDNFRNVDNTRLLTGIKPLDDASGGLSRKDELMIISARLGIGKSWIAHYIAKSMCEQGHRVGLYSGEMSEDEVGARFDTLLSHISNYALTRGRDIDLTEHKAKLSIITGDLLVLTPRHLRHNATPNDLRRFVKEEDLDVLIIDQLSLMEPDGKRGGEDSERKALLSYQLKSLQQELLIPFVAVSQLNRQAAQQEADASNISGSDRIGQDATLIIALARKEDTLKMKVLKTRSFRTPEQPWEFLWDIDKGILEYKLSAMDAVRAKVTQVKAREAGRETTATTTEEDDLF